MPRYIDADIFKNLILNDMALAERIGKELNGYTDALFHLKTLPTADVAPRAEVERLQSILNSYALQYGTATDKEVFLKKERDDTVRKMQKMLKEKAIDVDTDDAALWMECVTIEDVNQIAKELLEENT